MLYYADGDKYEEEYKEVLEHRKRNY